MKLKPYPKYKDSGVDWIGQIPEGWEVHRLKHICIKYAEYGLNISSEEYQTEGIRFIRTTDIDDYGNLTKDGVYLNQSLCKGYILNSGDLLISRSGTIGRTFLFNSRNDKATYAGYLVRFSINKNKAIPKYIFYFTKTKSFYGWLETQSIETTIENVNGQKYANLLLTNPPLPDQRAIAAFLDRHTARIDALIEKNRRLIELLQEKRAALINHAVTKGLDPKAKMKDSGVDWIGQIPEGWEVRKLKYNCQVNPTGKKQIADEKTIVSFLPMEKVNENGEYDLESTAEYRDVSNGYTFFRDGDVIIAKITPCFENGKGALINGLIDGFGFGTTEFHVLRKNTQIHEKYLYYFTKTHLFRVIGEAYMYGAAGQKRISTEFVKEFPMTTPPLPEQRAIAAYLDKQTARIDRTISAVERKIELLEEYRKSLIHHVVTGKVDVRDAGVEA